MKDLKQAFSVSVYTAKFITISTALKTPVNLLSNHLSYHKADDFSAFFIDKIKTSAISSQHHTLPPLPSHYLLSFSPLREAGFCNLLLIHLWPYLLSIFSKPFLLREHKHINKTLRAGNFLTTFKQA